MWIPRKIEQFIEAIVSRLDLIEEALRNHNRTSDAADIRQENIWNEIGRRIAEVRPDDEYKRGANTYKYKSYRQQVVLNRLTLLLFCATTAAFLAAAYYACIAKSQLDQMRIATQQAKRSADIAACALKENQRQFQIASDNNQKQFSETLEQMKAQSRASASAANTAADALQISERAYVVSGGVQVDWARKVLYVPIENLGHIPSGQVHVIMHFSKITKNAGGEMSDEVKWTEAWFNSLTSNAPVTSPQITFEPNLARSGVEFIHLGIEIEYHDGFKGTPLRTQGTASCSFHSKEGTFLFGPCPFTNMLEVLKKADQYPSPKYRVNIPITEETMQPPVPTVP